MMHLSQVCSILLRNYKEYASFVFVVWFVILAIFIFSSSYVPTEDVSTAALLQVGGKDQALLLTRQGGGGDIMF